MVFSNAQSAGKSVATVDVPAEERARFSLSDAEVEELARFALIIERHYGRPMDIEWGRDGQDGKLYILQARPETVKSQQGKGAQTKFKLGSKSAVLATGRAIGQKIGQGKVRLIKRRAKWSGYSPATFW